MMPEESVVNLPDLLSSIGGIAAVTLVIVAILRSVLMKWKVPVLSTHVPTWVYAVLVSAVLSALSIVMQWMDSPNGDWRTWVEFFLNVGMAAAVASGVREWFKSMGTTPAKAAAKTSSVILLGLTLFVTGCNPAERAFYESSRHYYNTVGEDYVQLKSDQAARQLVDLQNKVDSGEFNMTLHASEVMAIEMEKSAAINAHETYGEALDERKKSFEAGMMGLLGGGE